MNYFTLIHFFFSLHSLSFLWLIYIFIFFCLFVCFLFQFCTIILSFHYPNICSISSLHLCLFRLIIFWTFTPFSVSFHSLTTSILMRLFHLNFRSLFQFTLHLFLLVFLSRHKFISKQHKPYFFFTEQPNINFHKTGSNRNNINLIILAFYLTLVIMRVWLGANDCVAFASPLFTFVCHCFNSSLATCRSAPLQSVCLVTCVWLPGPIMSTCGRWVAYHGSGLR